MDLYNRRIGKHATKPHTLGSWDTVRLKGCSLLLGSGLTVKVSAPHVDERASPGRCTTARVVSLHGDVQCVTIILYGRVGPAHHHVHVNFVVIGVAYNVAHPFLRKSIV